VKFLESPTYVYDAENRLVNYASANTTYIYDGNGLRVKKCLPNCASPTTTTVYLFSGSKVIAEYVNGALPASPAREYIYSGGALLAKIESGATKYYHQDHLSNRLVTDSNANTAAQMGHFPFGESWYNATSDKLLFTTYERDSESGNDFAMARYYMSRLARLSSPDPLTGLPSDPQSLNRYPYSQNDPINMSDPSGERPLVYTSASDFSAWAVWAFEVFQNGADAVTNNPPDQINVGTWDDPTWVEGDYPPNPGQDAIDLMLPTPGVPGDPGDKGRDVIDAALKEKNLSKCLHKFFGPGTILTNENLPRINASKDLSGGAVGQTDARRVPDVGRGTVQIAKSMFNSLSANDPFLTRTYLHETANALAIQRFTDIQPRAARMERGPLGGPPTSDQQKERRASFGDPDIGNQFEKCLREN
jgi:RHS repeat-associated protein